MGFESALILGFALTAFVFAFLSINFYKITREQTEAERQKMSGYGMGHFVLALLSIFLLYGALNMSVMLVDINNINGNYDDLLSFAGILMSGVTTLLTITAVPLIIKIAFESLLWAYGLITAPKGSSNKSRFR